ncbi:MAG: histidine kinase dimerization/phosphoacceptor domain -containing protein, partial [Pseudomonadota bacterium]
KHFRFTERTQEGALIEAAQRKEYVVVYYIVPLETNKPALGYNIASETTRLQAINKAFKTGGLTATERITLVQETGTQFGVLVFFPLYKQGVSPKTSEARLKCRKGLVVEVLRLGDVVESALKGFPDEEINLCLYDVSAEKGKRLLYARPSHMPGMTEPPMGEEEIQEGLHWNSNFEIAGRQWKLLFITPSPRFLDSKQSWQPWLVLFGSLLLTAVLLLYLLKRLHYITEIESRMGEQLRTNQELANEITDRKQAEQKLLKSEEKYRSILENIEDGYFEVDIAGSMTFLNNSGCRMVGATFAEIMGMNYRKYTDKENSKILYQAFNKVFGTGEPSEGLAYEIIGKEGTKLYIESSVSLIRNTSGQPIGFCGIMRNITERKRAEEKIKASLREKETMLKEIHHRVKNNLQVISSLLDIQSSYLQDEEIKAIFQQSVERVKTMAMIHTQLYQSTDLALIDFGDFIRDLAGRLQQSYVTAGSPIEFHIDIPDEIRLGIETSIPCGLILNEMVSNALRHAFPEGRGGVVTISMKRAGDRFVLTVQDNGIGFPVTVDFQNPRSLGLELVNLLVEQIDGAIDLQVEGGTTFTVTFPAE